MALEESDSLVDDHRVQCVLLVFQTPRQRCLDLLDAPDRLVLLLTALLGRPGLVLDQSDPLDDAELGATRDALHRRQELELEAAADLGTGAVLVDLVDRAKLAEYARGTGRPGLWWLLLLVVGIEGVAGVGGLGRAGLAAAR